MGNLSILYDTLSFLEEYGADMPESFTTKLQELRTAFDIYDIELVQDRKISSEKLLKEEEERNFAIRKIYTVVRVYTDYHYDHEKMEAAKYLRQIFKYYGTGSLISRMNQDAKRGLLINLLQDLAKPDAVQHLSKLHLTDAVKALTTHNKTFESEQLNRRIAKAEYVKGVAKEARLNVRKRIFGVCRCGECIANFGGAGKICRIETIFERCI